MTNKRTTILLIVLIIITIFVVLLPRFSHTWLSEESSGFFYSYPLHTDEWQHYTVSSSLEDDFLRSKVFYYQNQDRIIDGSPLFHWIIFLSQKLGVSPEKFFLLPVLQGIFFIFVLFFFLSLIYNHFVGFIGSLLTLFIRSDIAFLGLLFFKPFVLGFALFLFALFFLHKNKKTSFSFFLVSMTSILCYPPFILLLIIYTLVYQLINKGINKKYLFQISILGFLTLIFGLFITKGNTTFLIDKIFYKNSIIGLGGVNLINYFGIFLIIFGLIGFIKTLKNKKLWPWHALFLFFVLNFIFVLITKCSLGFHYMRIIYLSGIFISVYAAKSIVDIFKWLGKNIRKKVIKILFILLSIAFIIFPTFIFYAYSDSSANPAIHASWLAKDNLAALKYLNNLSDKNKKLLHPPRVGTVITPLTGFKVTALQTALTGGKTNRFNEIMSLDECSKIKEIIIEENYNLLWFKKDIDCSFLNPIFESKSAFIYKYQDL